MAENEKIKRRQGQHYKKNEVKTEIIKCILNANAAISGSEIRRHLNEMYGIGNKRNIKGNYSA